MVSFRQVSRTCATTSAGLFPLKMRFFIRKVVLGECLFAEVRFDLLAERNTDSLSRKFRLLKILL
jgi:hypothetical protein